MADNTCGAFGVAVISVYSHSRSMRLNFPATYGKISNNNSHSAEWEMKGCFLTRTAQNLSVTQGRSGLIIDCVHVNSWTWDAGVIRPEQSRIITAMLPVGGLWKWLKSFRSNGVNAALPIKCEWFWSKAFCFLACCQWEEAEHVEEAQRRKDSAHTHIGRGRDTSTPTIAANGAPQKRPPHLFSRRNTQNSLELNASLTLWERECFHSTNRSKQHWNFQQH